MSGKSGRRGKNRKVSARGAAQARQGGSAPSTVRPQPEVDAERQIPGHDLRYDGHVAADLRRIGIIAGAMILVIILLFFFLN